MTLHGEWLVLAERVLVDQNTNTLTFVSMLDEVRGLDLPALHPRFAFASLFSREGGAPAEPEDYEFRLVRRASDGSETVVHTIPVAWQPGIERMRIYTNFEFVKLLRPELVRFRVDWRAKGDARWKHGPSAPLAIKELVLPEELKARIREDRARLEAEFRRG